MIEVLFRQLVFSCMNGQKKIYPAVVIKGSLVNMNMEEKCQAFVNWIGDGKVSIPTYFFTICVDFGKKNKKEWNPV